MLITQFIITAILYWYNKSWSYMYQYMLYWYFI